MTKPTEGADLPDQVEAWLASMPPEDALAIVASLRKATGGADAAGVLRREPRLAAPHRSISTYRLRVELRHTDPPVWRRLEVAGDLRLHRLHAVLQAAMGWTDSHLHRFSLGTDRDAPFFVTDFDVEEGDEGVNEKDVRLDQVLTEVGECLLYEYDFGDGWDHILTLEAIDSTTPEVRARCVEGALACPPEDCGGIPGYEELAVWVRSGRPADVEIEGLSAAEVEAWLPPGWDPDRFDLAEADDQVAQAIAISGFPEELVQILRRLGPDGHVQVYEWLADPVWRDPARVDAAAAERLLAAYRILLEEVGDGVRLTAAGWLPPATVERLAAATGVARWWIGKANREDLTTPIQRLRETAQHLGLVTKRKGVLAVTAAGRKVAADPVAGWRHVLKKLPVGRSEFDRHAGWLILLVAAAGTPHERWSEVTSELLFEMGWRTGYEGNWRRPTPHSPTRDVLGILAGDLATGWNGTPKLTDDVAITARAALLPDTVA